MEVKAICKKTGVEEYSSNEVNHSVIYKLNDGKVLVWPASGQLALQFDNEQEYRSAIVNDHIPLKSTSPIEREEDQVIIMGMPGNAQMVIDQLSAKLGMPLKLEGLDDAYIKAFVNKVAKYGFEKAYDELFLAIGIYVGELVQRSKKLVWQREKRYGINPYYGLVLTDDRRHIWIFRDVVRFLDEKSKTAGIVMMQTYRN